MKKRLAVLGVTGSIGRQTLDILRARKDCYEPVLFTANKNSGALIELKKEFPGVLTALAEGSRAEHQGQIDFFGSKEILDAISAAGAEITVNAISGAAGLLPSLAVLNNASDLALANKETAVMAGKYIFALAAEKKARIIPVDSEHSAIGKLLDAHGRENTREIMLTASGGPFRNHTMEQLSAVNYNDALAHPTWNMGPKISVDSATLANKGLEVIEAAVYFNYPPEKIKVVIHPQSIVHSMIRLKDGAVYAQLSKPDMRLVIHNALTWPRTEETPYGALDFDSLSLSFEKPDEERFPMLGLAYRALRNGSLLPTAYNAANEEAVQAFIKGGIGFLEIPAIVGYVLDTACSENTICSPNTEDGIDAVLEADRKARDLAREYIYGVRQC